MHSRLITVICVVVGKCMYLVVCPYVLCMNRISLSDAALHIFAFECPNHSECCRFCRCRCCCYCRFDTAHFTFYSRFLCTWLKIMCSVSLPSLVYLFALLFVDFSRIHSVSLSPFSIIISFLFALVFLLLITGQRYCYIKASQANGLTCTFWYVYSLFLNAHLAQYRWEFWWKCVFLSWIFDRFVPFKFALKHVPPASMTIRLFTGSVS